MFKAVQVLVAVGVSLLLLYISKGQLVYQLKGYYLIPYVVLTFAIFGTLFPKVFGMGIQGQRKANVAKKTIPLVYLALVIYVINLMEQTYASVAFTSILIGNGLAYFGYIFAHFIPKRFRKGAKK